MTRLVDRTHGRWPWIAAAGAVPATAICVARRDRLAGGAAWALWGSLPALFWHETEEWVVPGGFMPWFNRELMGSSADEYPLTRGVGLGVNVGAGWGLSIVAGLLGPRRPQLAAALLTSHVGNAALHLATAARTRRYNPGAVTSALLLAPLGIGGLAALTRRPEVRPREVASGVALGIAASVGLFAVLRRRVRT